GSSESPSDSATAARSGLSSFPIRPPPRAAPFPYTTLFRSLGGLEDAVEGAAELAGLPPHPRVIQPRRRFSLYDLLRTQLGRALRSEEHTSELQSRENLVCRLPLEKKKQCHRFQCPDRSTEL